jgi:hypothetical protein
LKDEKNHLINFMLNKCKKDKSLKNEYLDPFLQDQSAKDKNKYEILL